LLPGLLLLMISFPEERPFRIGRRIIYLNRALLDFIKQGAHGGKMAIGMITILIRNRFIVFRDVVIESLIFIIPDRLMIPAYFDLSQLKTFAALRNELDRTEAADSSHNTMGHSSLFTRRNILAHLEDLELKRRAAGV